MSLMIKWPLVSMKQTQVFDQEMKLNHNIGKNLTHETNTELWQATMHCKSQLSFIYLFFSPIKSTP